VTDDLIPDSREILRPSIQDGGIARQVIIEGHGPMAQYLDVGAMEHDVDYPGVLEGLI
jgi:hypothetical protein